MKARSPACKPSIWVALILIVIASFSFCLPVGAAGAYRYDGSVDGLRRYLLDAKDAHVFIGSRRNIYISEPLEFSGDSLEDAPSNQKSVGLTCSKPPSSEDVPASFPSR